MSTTNENGKQQVSTDINLVLKYLRNKFEITLKEKNQSVSIADRYDLTIKLNTINELYMEIESNEIK